MWKEADVSFKFQTLERIFRIIKIMKFYFSKYVWSLNSLAVVLVT